MGYSMAYGIAGRPQTANTDDRFVDLTTGNTYIYKDGWFLLGQEPDRLPSAQVSEVAPAEEEPAPKKRTRKTTKA